MKVRLLLVAATLGALCASPAWARPKGGRSVGGMRTPAAAASPAVLHAILYLYKSDFGESRDENDGIDVWAFPLYQLGFTVTTFDTKDERPPDDGFMAGFHGILAPTGAWETSKVWADWLRKQVQGGRKLLIMAPLGPGDPDEDEDDGPYPILPDDDLNQVYGAVGFKLDSTFALEEGEGGAALVRWQHKEDGWFGYDKDLVQGDTPFYLKWSPVGDDVRSLLTLCWEGIPGTDSVAVGFTGRGGLAIEEYIKFVDFTTDETRWRIDPVRFLGEAFGVGDLPRPEVNVICGNRTMLVHFGGRGLRATSDDGARTVGRAIVDDVLAGAGRPRFPVTLAGVQAADVASLGTALATTNGYDDVLATAHNVRVTAATYGRFQDPDPDFRPDESAVLVFPTAAAPVEAYVEKVVQSPFGTYFGHHERKVMLLPTQRPEPLNLYVPYDLAERQGVRDVLRRLMDWAGEQPATPVFLDEYLQMAKAGRDAAIGRTGDGGFFVEQDGALPTLRFDRNQGYPDLERSTGVIGYYRKDDSLYVYLNEGTRQTVYLTAARPEGFCLTRANRPVRDLRRDDFRWLFTTRGPMPARLEFQGLRPGDTYVVELFDRGSQDAIADEQSFRADEAGRGTLELDYPGWARVEFWSSTAESYWLVKLKRFFWRTGTLPVVIVLLVVLAFWLVWKVAGLLTARGARTVRPDED